MKLEEVRSADTGRVMMREIDNASRAASLHSWSQMLPLDERYELAWESIAEACANHEERLRFSEMVQVGKDAIDSESRDWLRHHGRSNARSHMLYWLDWNEPHTTFEAQLCDTLAVGQIMRALPSRLRTALVALAVSNDLEGASRMLGQHYDTVARNVREARVAVFAMWFGDEAPPTPRRDRRTASYSHPRQQFCPKGHELTPDNCYRVGNGQRTCKTCQIERSAKNRAAAKRRRRAEANRVVAERRARYGGVSVKGPAS
jgi:hypothetical protein